MAIDLYWQNYIDGKWVDSDAGRITADMSRAMRVARSIKAGQISLTNGSSAVQNHHSVASKNRAAAGKKASKR